MTEFNVGDVVRCTIDTFMDTFSLGKLYVVKNFPDDYGYLIVEEDDKGSNTNGLHPSYFELVRRKGEFKVGDIVSWKDVPYWQNAIVRRVGGNSVYADSEGKNTVSGEGLFYQDDKFYELTLVKPVEENKTTMNLTNSSGGLFYADDFGGFRFANLIAESKNHELTVNEARAIAVEIGESITSVIDIYDELIKRGFKITKD